MRKLASIVTVSSIMKMYQKDRIVCVSFNELGYEAIVPNTVKVGDTLAFIQEGSILPIKEEWEFLRKRCFNQHVNGFVIKPMKMGKKELPDGSEGDAVKSWGLAVPLSELGLDESVIKKFKAGDDISDLLGIWKYEPAEDASPTKGESKKAYPKWVKFCLEHTVTRWIGRIWQKRHQNSGGGFPSELISKSDETTIQNMKGALQKYADEKVVITAKMEGQSCVSSDTIVDTEDGPKTIKELVDSNFSGKVWSMNDAGEKELKEVEKCHCLENDEKTEWYELETENGRKLKITGNDMVYLPELKCYRRVDQLIGNEKLLVNC